MGSVGLLFCVAVYSISKNTLALFDIGAISLAGMAFIAIGYYKQVFKVKKISRLIHNHIKENDLCQMERNGIKEIYTFYPEVSWRIDESVNTLFIRFRFTGNEINVRGLERGLADRFEKSEGGVLSVVKEFFFWEEIDAIVGLESIGDMLKSVRYSSVLGNELVGHLSRINREYLIPYSYDDTKIGEIHWKKRFLYGRRLI